MKEITRIHLAATPFNIDITAKKELEKYLEAIEKSLKADEDTLREIEARIVELLAERGVTGERVVTLGDIEVIERKLGSPADFTDEDEVTSDTEVVEKRLMRDDEQGLIGGVLAGIGAYIGINPNWVRLIAIALTFVSFGSAVLVYIVLWLALPMAKTAAEKLQMAGKPVTLAALKESSMTTLAEPRTKPLLVALRILFGLGFVVAAILPVVMVVFGVGVGVTEFTANQDLINGWLVAAFALLVVSGILFILLMIIAAYSTFAWRFSKGIAYAGLAIIIAGLVISATAFGLGIYGAQQANQKVDSLTKVYKTDLSSQFNGAKGLIVDGNTIPIEYRQTAGPARAELTTLDRGDGRPTVEAVRDGDVVRLKVKGGDSAQSCFIGGCGYGVTRIVVYGPALGSIEAKNGHFVYDGESQVDMSVTVKGDATVSISDTTITNLTANIEKDGALSTEDAAVENITLQTQSGGWVRMGVVSDLNITAATSCPAGSKTEISVEQVTTLRQAEQQIAKQAEININCAQITVDGMDDIDQRSQDTL